MMRKYSRIYFSEYTKEEFDELYLSYINRLNITIKVSKDIDTEIDDIIKETFKDKRMFLVVKEELKQFNRYFIKRIEVPITKIELNYTETNKIQ